MFTQDNLDQVLKGTVFDQAGEKIGKVGDIYFDDVTNKPSWVTVNTGLFGTSNSFIPLDNASIEGDEIRVPFTKDKVKDAPRIDADRHLSVEEERELYRYYGADYDAGYTTAGDPDRGADHGADGQAGLADARYANDPDHGADNGADAGAEGRRVAGDDASIVRHEEQLRVGTTQREAGRVRLRKHVVNEQQTVTVPVTHEEVRVTREPIRDGEVRQGELRNTGDEATAEVTLTEDQVVVSKENVPVERVSLDKETVTEQRQVTETVAHEEIDVDRTGGVDVEGRRKESLGDKIKDKLDRDNDGKVL